MRLWKRNSASPAAPDRSPRANLFEKLKKEVAPLRKQGEPPAKDPGSFGKYRCDLCNAAFPLQDLRQCVICGRWACNGCFSEGYYVCRSCNGIIQLNMK